MSCLGTKADGSPCDSPVVGADNYCPAHRPGDEAARHDKAMRGGLAHAAKYRGDAFTADELPDLESVDDAKKAFSQVRRAVGCRRITHAEGNAMNKAIEGWLKANEADVTERLTEEFEAAIRDRDHEIAELRQKLSKRHALRAS